MNRPVFITTEIIILLGLVPGPCHGLALIERLDAMTKGVVKLKQATVYPALHRLEKEGFLRVHREATTVRGRPREVYTLNATGRWMAGKAKKVLRALVGEG